MNLIRNQSRGLLFDLKHRENVVTFEALTGQRPDYLEQLFIKCKK